MTRDLVIWGGKAHAKVVRDIVEPQGFRLRAVFDNDRSVTSPFPDVGLAHGEAGYRRWKNEHFNPGTACLVAMGGSRGRPRFELQEFFESEGFDAITAVHPRAWVAPDVSIPKGTHIMANAAVGTSSRLGKACIVNTSASVDHDATLGDGVHVAPGATLAGSVTVGEFTLIGIGAVVLPSLRIGRDVIVGAGAVVTKDVPDGVVIYGNPARVQRPNVVTTGARPN